MNKLTEDQLKQYHQDGFILLKNFFNREEIELLHKSAVADRTLDEQSYGRKAGADMERVEEALKRMELIYVIMDPGDAVFFHSNLLHRSDQNKSDQSRWSMVCCYNARSNDPYKDSHHPRYTPLAKVDDDAIKRDGISRFADDGSDAFLNPDDDQSAK
jgi:hypothetical protein